MFCYIIRESTQKTVHVLGIYVETKYVSSIYKKKDIASSYSCFLCYFCTLFYIPENVIVLLRFVWNLSTILHQETCHIGL